MLAYLTSAVVVLGATLAVTTAALAEPHGPQPPFASCSPVSFTISATSQKRLVAAHGGEDAVQDLERAAAVAQPVERQRVAAHYVGVALVVVARAPWPRPDHRVLSYVAPWMST
ncbi:hypothetical protein B0T26DRAFT_703608 [Lasiosphaeria miniovina]|uniref:Uncharacterized protein n=1 Tax=Lasiosphaeria miniovina TaxID=1954250 RepID=A0AA40E0Q2_9PEZI|nr:uncharacterized protein B0T26DRAFT_703608 [Lasiosphaeria miniovina]KAK0722690.1 hypothetical protein B0T26DRAFT_703608 [Lasiosphaeria miniovina]